MIVIKLESFSNLTVLNYTDGATLSMSVESEELINQIPVDEVVKNVDIEGLLSYHDHHEVIEKIGDIEKFVEVFGRAAILDYLQVNESEEEL